jgi:prepilin-type N-terminal cleavage/methylation domain-containing protein/prepilin-type processing-associated H-X9-DG protein
MKTPIQHHRFNRAGFTLIELLAVIVIISVLAGIILTVVSKSRETTEKSACMSNLRQTYAACMLYAADYKYLPDPEAKTSYSGPGVQPNWCAEILPYYTTRAAGSASLGKLTTAEALICPTHKRHIDEATGRNTLQNYGMNYALGYSSSNAVRRTPVSIPMPAKTLMITEGGYNATANIATLNGFYLRTSARFNDIYIGGAHNGANNILWCDGHVSSWQNIDLLTANNDTGIGPASKYWTPGFSSVAP